MKTVVIISEYSPFHSGHGFMICELRKKLGDIGVAALMSDPFTERGEPAVFPSEVRAEAAVLGGADLVLSLPMPYCASGGAYFASAGVRAAAELFPGAILAFGSESGDLAELETAAENLENPELEKMMSEITEGEGIASAREAAYTAVYGAEAAKILQSPNNLLGIEYISAIRRFGLNMTPYTLRREGGEYRSSDTNVRFPSATALRGLLAKGDFDGFLTGVPESAAEVYGRAIESGNYSRGFDKIGSAVLSFFRLNTPADGTAEMQGGLSNRLSNAASSASDIDEFFSLAASKCYTNAKIRRGVLSAMLGISAQDLSEIPKFLRLLALDSKGREMIKNSRHGETEIVDKPSEYRSADRQRTIYRNAEALYDLTLESPRGAAFFMTISPVYIDR